MLPVGRRVAQQAKVRQHTQGCVPPWSRTPQYSFWTLPPLYLRPQDQRPYGRQRLPWQRQYCHVGIHSRHGHHAERHLQQGAHEAHEMPQRRRHPNRWNRLSEHCWLRALLSKQRRLSQGQVHRRRRQGVRAARGATCKRPPLGPSPPRPATLPLTLTLLLLPGPSALGILTRVHPAAANPTASAKSTTPTALTTLPAASSSCRGWTAALRRTWTFQARVASGGPASTS